MMDNPSKSHKLNYSLEGFLSNRAKTPNKKVNYLIDLEGLRTPTHVNCLRLDALHGAYLVVDSIEEQKGKERGGNGFSFMCVLELTKKAASFYISSASFSIAKQEGNY